MDSLASLQTRQQKVLEAAMERLNYVHTRPVPDECRQAAVVAAKAAILAAAASPATRAWGSNTPVAYYHDAAEGPWITILPKWEIGPYPGQCTPLNLADLHSLLKDNFILED